MAAPIIERLKVLVTADGQLSTAAFPASFMKTEDEKNPHWTFHQTFLNQSKPDFFRRIIPHHVSLALDLSVLRSRLAKDLVLDPNTTLSEQQTAAIIDNLQAALALSAILEKLNREYLQVPREVARLLREQQEYQQWLAFLLNCQFDGLNPQPVPSINQGLASSQYIRTSARDLNPLRLILLRIRRFFILLAVVLAHYPQYGLWLNAIEVYSGPLFANLAWIFFIPRLTVNLALTIKHVFNPWMSKEISELGWQARLLAQLERRWPELTNDIAWFLNGMLMCFVFTGNLLPMAIYFAISMQAYDFLMAGLRTAIELQRFATLKNQYLDALTTASPAEQTEINAHLAALEIRINLERQVLAVNMTNFGVLLLAISLSLPAIAAFSPWLPISGAVIAIIITGVTYFSQQHLDQKRQQNYLAVGWSPPPEDGARRARFFPATANTEDATSPPSSPPETPTASGKRWKDPSNVLPNKGYASTPLLQSPSRSAENSPTSKKINLNTGQLSPGI